jgi:hypothetical protein
MTVLPCWLYGAGKAADSVGFGQIASHSGDVLP